MPEQSVGILTYLAALGASAIAGVQVFILRQNSTLKQEMVAEKRCKEMRETYQKNIEDKIDSVKSDTEKQWGVIQEIRDAVIKTKTIIEERDKR